MRTSFQPPTDQRFSPWATVACCAAMAGIGLLWAAYGPAIPQLRQEFGVTEFAAGLPLAIQSAGSVLGALAVPTLLRRFGHRTVFASAFITLGLGAAIIGSIPAWAAVMVGAIIAGLGLGCCDTLVSQSFITGQGRHGAALVNVAHGCFGIGTVLAPALIAILGASLWPFMFFFVSGLMVLALTGLGGISSERERDAVSRERERAPKRSARTTRLVIGGFLVIYVAHFGVQSGIGSWEPTLLVNLGSTALDATLATSAYWLAMVAGRLAAIPFTHRFRPSTIVLVSAVGMTASVALATIAPDATVVAYVLAGFMIGPIFPTGLTWLLTSGHARGGTFSYVVASAVAGSIFVPPLLGALLASSGTDALAPTLLVIAAGATAGGIAVAWLLRRERRHAAASGPTTSALQFTKTSDL